MRECWVNSTTHVIFPQSWFNHWISTKWPSLPYQCFFYCLNLLRTNKQQEKKRHILNGWFCYFDFIALFLFSSISDSFSCCRRCWLCTRINDTLILFSLSLFVVAPFALLVSVFVLNVYDIFSGVKSSNRIYRLWLGTK